MDGLLKSLTVLEVGNEFGEWTGRVLADLGARVIKIEPPSGSPTRQMGPFYEDKPDPELSLHFWQYNAGKYDITLDLGTPEGQKDFRKLVAKSDILVESYRPGQMAQWGLGYEDLAPINPRLIECSVSPFGQTGPHSGFAATDMTVLALGGITHCIGYDDHSLPPATPGGGQSYHASGNFAVAGILLALIQRATTGKGQYIDVPAHACLGVSTEYAPLYLFYQNNVINRLTGRHSNFATTPPQQFPTKDGRYANLHQAHDAKSWHGLLGWFKEEGLVEDLEDEKYEDINYRREQQFHISEITGKLALRYTAEELFHRGQALGLPWSIVRRPEEWLDDPHAKERETFLTVEHPEVGKSFLYARPPYRFSDAEATVGKRAPRLGEHNELILGDLGLSSEN